MSLHTIKNLVVECLSFYYTKSGEILQVKNKKRDILGIFSGISLFLLRNKQHMCLLQGLFFSTIGRSQIADTNTIAFADVPQTFFRLFVI